MTTAYSATDLIGRIQKIYSSCDDAEKSVLMTILQELADTGESPTYEQVWLSDYREIPVDIDTFLNSDTYLGKTNRNGQAVYPFWRQELHNVFDAGNKYYEWIFTGATRIGKTSTAISALCYMLYRLMCLKDPQKYFGKKEISTFSILFFNVTIDLAESVAYREFQSTVLSCPWFLAHGYQAGSDKNPYYVPEGGKISIDVGSSGAHALGQQVYCLVGDTKIVTSTGVKTLSEIECRPISVQQFHNGELIWSDAYVLQTDTVSDTIRIELEDGTIIEGTPDHRILLSNGEYIALKDIKGDEDICTVQI